MFLALLGIGCVTPTLPLPPPASPTIFEGAEQGTYRLSSDRGAVPNALIIIINRDESLSRDKRVSGTFADENGSWDALVYAKVGDVLDVSQESGDADSSATTVTVR